MNKNTTTALCIAFSIICCFACEDGKEEYPDIRIGKENPVDELSLNKQTEKRLLISGGNGKYIVNVENSRIATRSEEHTSELQSRQYLVCRLLLEKKKRNTVYNN